MAKKKASTDGDADKKLPKPEESAHAKQLDEIAKAQKAHVEETGDDEAVDLDAQAALAAEAAGKDPEVGDLDTDPEPDPDADPEGGDPEPDPNPEPTPTEEMVDLVIDGITQSVPKSKVYEQGVRSMQKEISADKKLADATKRQQELDAREAKLNERATSANQQLDKGGDDDLQLDEAEIASIADALKYGDDKKSTEALTKLVKAVRGAKATKGATLSQTEVQTAIRSELDRVNFESALDVIKKPQSEGGYGDLMADHILYAAFAAEDKRLSEDADGKKLPYLDRMKKAGDTVRAKLSPTNAGNSPKNGSTNAQRKAELGDTVVAAGGGNPGGKQPTKPLSERERHQKALEQVNKDRGRA